MAERPILFKGKRIRDKSWMCGYYIQRPQTDDAVKHYIAIGDKLGVNYYEIDEKTLCQYTGMEDKNGRSIWENDILQCHFDEKFPEDCTIYRIVFSNGEWQTKDKYGRDEKLDSFTCERGDVVGNVFDNPELMGNREQNG